MFADLTPECSHVVMQHTHFFRNLPRALYAVLHAIYDVKRVGKIHQAMLHTLHIRGNVLHHGACLQLYEITAEWAPLMIGGMEHTVLFASRMTGYTTESWMMGTNFFSFGSLSR